MQAQYQKFIKLYVKILSEIIFKLKFLKFSENDLS